MCGIAGIYHYSSDAPVAEGTLHRLCEALRHRGPDDEGYVVMPPAALGMRRLAVIDLATGHQPIANEDRSVWIVCNGEIYNFAQLRADLSARHTFTTASDTEVIVHLYEEYGDSCVDHLRGMFAFAVWDVRRGRLLLARDRLGKKPLYYAIDNGCLSFASEIGALKAALPGPWEIDQSAIDHYLAYQYIPSPHTIYRRIRSLEPAHVMVFDRAGKTVHRRYWDISYRAKTTMTFAEACDETERLLSESTRLRMRADVPLGAFLSGGQDSSIIVGLMSRASSQPVKTFSVGFEESGFSELPYARLVAEQWHTDHHEIMLRPQFRDILPTIARIYGQPFADQSALPSYIIAQETRRHVTVALNGDGGDEAFGGYRRYQGMYWSSLIPWPLSTPLAADILRYLAGSRGTASRSIGRFIDGLGCTPDQRMARYASFVPAQIRQRLYLPGLKEAHAIAVENYIVDVMSRAPADTVIDRALYTDYHTYLPECLMVKMDIAAMAHGLEARSPFLDHLFVEFAASLPSSWKVRGMVTKRMLRAAFASLLPPQVQRRGKQGFGIPLSAWIRGPWKAFFSDIAFSARASARGYFDMAALRAIFQEHVSGSHDHGSTLWAVLMLELWHREIHDAA